MFQGDKPDLLIYHGPSCLDGWGCKWAIHQKWPDVPAIIGVYGQAPPDVTGMRVLIADFSYSEETLRDMAAVAKEVIILDHHKGVQEHVTKLLREGVVKGEFNLEKSGAAMAWQYAWGNPRLPKVIEHVQDRDLWKFEVPHTREVCACLYSIGDDMEAWTDIGKALEVGRHMDVFHEGSAIMRAEARNRDQVIAAGMRYMIIGGHKVPVCNAPYFWASEIAHQLAEGNAFAATYMDLPHGRQFSLRSNGGLEVHTIAKEYGGGGHPGAAGFTAPAGWEGDVDDQEEDIIPLRPGAQVTLREG